MDRTYVAQQHKTPVFQLGLDLWRDAVLHAGAVRARVLSVLQDMVARERGGEVIDRALVRATTQVGSSAVVRCAFACGPLWVVFSTCSHLPPLKKTPQKNPPPISKDARRPGAARLRRRL